MPGALLAVDRTGLIRLANHQTELLFGYHPGELIGLAIETLVPESLRHVHRGHRQDFEAAPSARPMGTDLRLSGLRREGTVLPVDVSLSTMNVGDDRLVIAVVRDMTRYWEAEADRRRLDRMAAVVKFSGEAIVSVGRDGDIRSWNPAAERMFGYSREEIIGRSIMLLTPESRLEESRAILAGTRDGQSVEDLETLSVRKDGSELEVSLTISPIYDLDGTITGASTTVRDLTRQKKVFEAAQQMAAVVEHGGEAIISHTPDGIITSWNPAAERIFGYSAKEIMGRSIELLTPESRRDEDRAVLTGLRAGRPVEHRETTRLRKDGTLFPVSITVSGIRDSDGAVVGASVIAHDATAQRQAIEYSERLASIVESSQDAIISSALDGIITSWNPAAERMFGYSAAEIIGRPGTLLGADDPVDKIGAVLGKVSAGQRVERFEAVQVRKDGTRVPVAVTTSGILDAEGVVVGAAAIMRDLTEQRRTFESARSMIEASLDSLVAISPEGKITDANAATVKVTGVPREELIGTSFSEYFTDPVKADEIYQRVISEGPAVDYPLTLRRRDGRDTLTDVLYNASAYRDADGNVLGVFAAARDVTKQVEAQRALAAQQAGEKERLAELERFQRLTVGRELKMIELKKEIAHLRKSGPAAGDEPGTRR